MSLLDRMHLLKIGQDKTLTDTVAGGHNVVKVELLSQMASYNLTAPLKL
jgi:hypothetical protein